MPRLYKIKNNMSITTLIQNNPRIAIIILSFLVTLFITIVNSLMIDKLNAAISNKKYEFSQTIFSNSADEDEDYYTNQ